MMYRYYPPYLLHLFHLKPTLSCHSLQKTLNSVTYSTPVVGPTSHAPLLGPGLIRKVSLASPLLLPSEDENKICLCEMLYIPELFLCDLDT